MMTIHILLGTDERYLPGAVVTAASAVCAAPADTPFAIHIMDCGLSPESRDSFSSFFSRFGNASLQFHDIDLSVFREMDVPTFGVTKSVAIYGRLLAPEFIRANRVIYIDTDFFIQRDLSEAWNLPMDGMAIAACLNTSRSGWANCDTLACDCPFTADPSILSRPYYNSGFLMINLEWWRANDVTKRAFDLLRGPIRVSRHDQTLINWLCTGSTITLDPSWNSTPWWTRPLQPGVNLHFSSDFKPWISPFYLPAERLWFDFYNREIRPYWDPAANTRHRVLGFLRFLRHYGLPAVFPKTYRALRRRFRQDSEQRRSSDAELYDAMHQILFHGLDDTTRKTLAEWKRRPLSRPKK